MNQPTPFPEGQEEQLTVDLPERGGEVSESHCRYCALILKVAGTLEGFAAPLSEGEQKRVDYLVKACTCEPQVIDEMGCQCGVLA